MGLSADGQAYQERVGDKCKGGELRHHDDWSGDGRYQRRCSGTCSENMVWAISEHQLLEDSTERGREGSDCAGDGGRSVVRLDSATDSDMPSSYDWR